MGSDTTLWELGAHTRGKHLVLKNYLDAWFPIMGSWAGRILFIDGFAGPGEYKEGEEGSPLIALRSFMEHCARGVISSEVVFLFVEKDERRAAYLDRLVESWRPRMPPNCHVGVSCGAFDEKMTQVLDELEKQNRQLAPSFVMVDPFGVSETPMSVLRRILRNPRSEVYVSFMYEAINRFKATPEFELHLDQLFGCGDWRDGISITDPDRRKRFFCNLYDEQLHKAGARYVVHFELYQGNRLVYAIFFGTKHLRGCDRMKQAIWKVAPFGDYAFWAARSSVQLTMDLNAADYRPLRRTLRQQFQGKGWVPIEEIMDLVSSDQTEYHTGQLKRGALRDMEDGDELEVLAGTRKRRRTYPDGTRIRFL